MYIAIIFRTTGNVQRTLEGFINMQHRLLFFLGDDTNDEDL